ncbi:2-methylaconitate cis-trans isomerase PrpF family protein [Chitinimonas lacunae]|uniref:2-methylaconitate cis-trans isomerase PrpF family protein n=1 Tax=Chitinimonas lacunae TaxID=1963018 RepID=A0ABV8MVS2_9NEIS
MPLFRIPAVSMRGGTSKGVFFRGDDLPQDPALVNRLLARVVGSPDPYGRQIDGLGTGVSSTSKVVIVSRSEQPDCDVDYLFGHVDIASGTIDWSGNCGNLSAAVAPFAVLSGLVPAPEDGPLTLRIWQANTEKAIVAQLEIEDGLPRQDGDFRLDGVPFSGSPVQLDFLDPAGGVAGKLFPTGQPVDRLEVPGIGALEVTLIDAGNPLVLARAADLGLTGLETPNELNRNPTLLAGLEAVRSYAAVAMGLAESPLEASLERPSVPKLAWVAPPQDYRASDGEIVPAAAIDCVARIVSMGKLHHAFTGTGTIGLAAAAALPGTIASEVLGEPITDRPLRFGHPSGINDIEVSIRKRGRQVSLQSARLVRSARVLMNGEVWVSLD